MSLEEDLDLELNDSDGSAEEEEDQSEEEDEEEEEDLELNDSDGGAEEEEDQSEEEEKEDSELNDSDGVAEEEGDQSEEGDEEEEEGLSGWADSMSKILKSTKPKNKKTLLLSRARKDYEINQNVPIVKKGSDIEIARDDSKPDKEIKEEDAEKNEEDSNILSLKQQRKLELKQRKLEKAWENLNRMTGDVADMELETDLVKIATKGVVQLFNAVAQQQKTVKTKLRESRNSEFKKEKVLSKSKEIFESAMSKSKIVGKGDDDDGNSSDDEEIEIKEESSSEDEEDKRKSRKRKASVVSTGDEKKPVWQALQEDFMLDAKMKDWDKDSGSD